MQADPTRHACDLVNWNDQIMNVGAGDRTAMGLRISRKLGARPAASGQR
jgi:hypothetical protein